MRTRTTLLMLLLCSGLAAEDQEKTQKKALEAQVKTMTAEAESLEKAGQLAEARIKYAESQALIEMKGVTDALKRLDEEIQKRVKNTLSDSRKLYELRKFKQAATALDEAMKLQAFQPVLAYDLALCYHQLGERDKALEYLGKAKSGTADPKQKQRLQQLLTFFTTEEIGLALSDSDRDRVIRVNRLAESIGLEASLEDEAGEETSFSEATPSSSELLSTNSPAPTHNSTSAGHRSSLCNALGELKGTLATSPSATFNLANCAETNGRPAEAVRLLEKYLEMTPHTLDADEVRARVADLKSLLTLPGQNGGDIRRLYASAYGSLAERKYDRALADFNKADQLAPEFALTKWKLALFYEAMGSIDRARDYFARYQELTSDQGAKDEANLHLTTLDAKRTRYDQEIDEADDLVSDLFNRAMNLSFNGSENHSALRAKRARVKKKDDQNKARNRVGGFAIPFAYAQQQLARASEHLRIALALFPLGAEANQLMGLVFLQANDGYSATKSFDVVASQGLPVAFYAEMRGHKQDQAVKCELSRDRLRLIILSSYDKKGKPAPPSKPAGEDGLGDMVMDPSAPRQQGFDSLDMTLGEIKKVETDKGLLKLKLAQQEITLSPIYLPSFTPIEGPQARRFANNYTRLFVRYPGLEDSKLGTEGMSGGEKFKMGYNIANASVDIAMSGFSPISAIGSVQDAISITRTIRAAMVSLSVSFATWEKSVDDQQQLLAGKSFKAIPTQPVNLAFAQETK
ncbi:MAG TPA: tetratricopeptide repeat protein [Terriglobales bacterium]|nr:tetratricopeptide repeat protein [Terriglobales bacterium]